MNQLLIFSTTIKKEVISLIILILSINLLLLLPYGIRLSEQIIIYSSLALIWVILYKFLGLFFLGTSGVFGLSTYLVSVLHGSSLFVTPLDMFVSVIAMGLILAPITYLILRTSGGYFALLTLGLNLIAPLIVSSLDATYFRVSARYLNFDITFIHHFTLLVIFFLLSFLYLYIHNPVKLKYTLLLIKGGKDVAESLGINYYNFRYITVLTLLFSITILGVIHSAYLFRVDSITIFPSELTLIPITAGLLIVIKTRGHAIIDIMISILIPLAYILFGVAASAFVEVLLGLTIFGVLILMFKKMLT